MQASQALASAAWPSRTAACTSAGARCRPLQQWPVPGSRSLPHRRARYPRTSMPVEEEVACLAWPRFEEPDPHPFPVAVEHAELVPCVLEAYLADRAMAGAAEATLGPLSLQAFLERFGQGSLPKYNRALFPVSARASHRIPCRCCRHVPIPPSLSCASLFKRAFCVCACVRAACEAQSHNRKNRVSLSGRGRSAKSECLLLGDFNMSELDAAVTTL